MTRSRRFPLFLAAALVSLCSFGFADSFSFGTDVNSPDSTEFTETFTVGSHSITAWGFSADNTPAELFFKNGSGDENGLGLVGTTDHEIVSTDFIQFTGAGIASITVGSVQNGESWALYGSPTLGTRGTWLKQGSADGVVTLPGGYTYYSLVAPSGDVLLDSANTAVPEPGTPALLMTMGLVGLFAFGSRKLSKLSL